jgi:hypothetical protein
MLLRMLGQVNSKKVKLSGGLTGVTKYGGRKSEGEGESVNIASAKRAIGVHVTTRCPGGEP